MALSWFFVALPVCAENTELQKAYQANEKEFLAAAADHDLVALNFRKKVCAYLFDRTQGLEPETIIDFIARESKRYYRYAKDKAAFEVDLPKVFALFAPNFPFTADDILKYAKDPGPIKHPKPKVIQQDSVVSTQPEAVQVSM